MKYAPFRVKYTLHPVVKITNDGENFELVHASHYDNPYYALIPWKGKLIPLPWLFPHIKTFVGMGRTLYNRPQPVPDAKRIMNLLPDWVGHWVQSWAGKWD